MANLQRSLVSILAAVTFLISSQAHCSDASVSHAWKSRSEIAINNLKQRNLDVCDIGIEKAFQNVAGKQSNGLTIYELNIQIGNQEMTVAYSYKKSELKDFILISLPSGWMAHQSMNSEAFSVVVADSNCAFDLCVNNPFSTTPCKAR